MPGVQGHASYDVNTDTNGYRLEDSERGWVRYEPCICAEDIHTNINVHVDIYINELVGK